MTRPSEALPSERGITVYGLGDGSTVPPVPLAGAGRRAFLPAGALRLARTLASAGWQIRPLRALSTAERGDVLLLLGGPEAEDPYFQEVLRSGLEVRVYPGQPLAALLGDGAWVCSSERLAGLSVLPGPTVIVGLPAEGRLPALWPGAEVVRLTADGETLRWPVEKLRLEDTGEGEALLVPGVAVPALAEMAQLLVIMARLRAPGGCPWDRAQDHASLRPYLLEEAAEACDAIATGDAYKMAEELGDLLLQVVFHSEIGREEGTFTFQDVARAIAEKLVRRHPHVFGAADVLSVEGVVGQWHELKRREGARLPSEQVAKSLGAIERAEKLAGLLRRYDLPAAVSDHPIWRMVSEAVYEGRQPAMELRAVVDQLLHRLDQLGDLDALDAEHRRRRWENGGA